MAGIRKYSAEQLNRYNGPTNCVFTAMASTKANKKIFFLYEI